MASDTAAQDGLLMGHEKQPKNFPITKSKTKQNKHTEGFLGIKKKKKVKNYSLCCTTIIFLQISYSP